MTFKDVDTLGIELECIWALHHHSWQHPVPFENTPDQYNTTAPIGFQIMSQVELVEVVGANNVEEVINQPITKG